MPIVLAVLLISGAPPPASAGGSSHSEAKATLLDSITQKMDALEYEEAREACLIALDRDDLSDDERVSVHMQAGIAQRVLDRSMESRMHFMQALKINPDATLPDETAPKIRTFFRILKDEVNDNAAERERTPPTPVASPASSPAESSPWPAYSLIGVGAVLAAVATPALLGAAAAIYLMVLPQPIDPQTKSIFRYGFFGAIAGAGGALGAGAIGATIGGTLLWLE